MGADEDRMSAGRLLRIADLPAQPWKNGGGITTEIAIDPPGASMEDFRWRVSLAQVAQDGPFSAFPGITRWITLIEGAGFVLDFADGSTLEVAKPFEPQRFDGGQPAQCRLLNGPCRDLNVMARADLNMQVAVLPATPEAPPPGHALISVSGIVVGLGGGLALTAKISTHPEPYVSSGIRRSTT